MKAGILVVALALTGAAFAQGPGGFRHARGMFAAGPGGPGGGAMTTDDIKAYLGLSDSQVQSLQQLQQQQMQQSQPLFQQIRQNEQALHTLIDSGSTDAAAIGNAFLAVSSVRKQIQQARAGLQTQALALLTPDQKTKLQGLTDAQKLEPAIHEAMMLGLLSGTHGGAGMFGAPAGGPFGH